MASEPTRFKKPMKSQNFPSKGIGAILYFSPFFTLGFVISLIITLVDTMPVQAGQMRALRGHLPPASALARPLGFLPKTNSLRLVISLPLRDGQEMSNLLQRIYDPASPDYHHYLTPVQFNARFGPTEQDYQRVIGFARGNGLAVVGTHDSRMLVDVTGTVSNVEKAFHVTLRSYQHPTENRNFYAPDVAPTVSADLPILDVTGMSDYAIPRPLLHSKAGSVKPVSATGSQASGYFLGNDFRNAYAPGVSLTGAGQMVGLLELDGYYSADITAYEKLAKLPAVPLINVPQTGFPSASGSDVTEVSLDIEMAIAMAPGLSAVVVFGSSDTQGTTGWMDILDSMASSNQIKQFSSSWGYTGSPDPNTTFDGIFQRMALQGQSFYQASGDGDAWVNAIWVPADSPYITSVGGTLLSMSGTGGAYSSESVWNEGNLGARHGWSANGNGYVGSGGGVSTVYTNLPYWQANAINSANQGSTNARNIPDVSLAADNIWVIYGNGSAGAFAGTSCAAPLWAGFSALINQQAAAGGNPSVGFINPAIYALGGGTTYAATFHDITSGNNTNALSTNRFSAVTGYDLCTGWGTPRGAALINALLPEMQVTPASPFAASGPFGGPFSGGGGNFLLTNIGAGSFDWTVSSAESWMTVSSNSGTFVSGGAAAVINLSLAPGAFTLPVGNYTNTVTFTDQGASMTQNRQFILTVTQAAPALGWDQPASIAYGTALGSNQLDATANIPGVFSYDPPAGAILNAGTNLLSVVFTPDDAVDYSTVTNTVSLVVDAAVPEVTWAGPGTITYGTALSSNQLDATANIPGSFAYNPVSGTILPPGTNALTVVFTPADALDYSNTTNSVNLIVTVMPIPLNIEKAGTNIVLTWDDPVSAFSLQAASGVTWVFSNVPGAFSPYTNPTPCGEQFFRLLAN